MPSGGSLGYSQQFSFVLCGSKAGQSPNLAVTYRSTIERVRGRGQGTKATTNPDPLSGRADFNVGR